MNWDYRTTVWTIGGYFLFAILFSELITSLLGDWRYGIPLVLCGSLLGFVLDQYYKRKESKDALVATSEGGSE